MSQKKIIPFINAENELSSSVLQLGQRYSCEGGDGLYLYNFTGDEVSHEEFLHTLRSLDKEIDVPFMAGIHVARFEDAKKALYTGASRVVMRRAMLPPEGELKEICSRFDRGKLALEIDMQRDPHTAEQLNAYYEQGFGMLILKHVTMSPRLSSVIRESKADILIRDSLTRNDLSELLSVDRVVGVSTNHFEDRDIYKAKRSLKQQGIDVGVFESSLQFSDFKTLDNGLVPAVVQDYRTGEVLMVAYMNEESFCRTLETGKMTYYSRSRQELWCKGDTSGHYQYVKKLMIDCDDDTILAKVHQIGAACHTGNRSCFFRELAGRQYVDTNPLAVLSQDFEIIKDRKEHPREGSYTNYLFDKGIDKILKKCGEEATEMVIAAKNPDREELKYEIADFLYHMMVLMAECGLEWNDITKELVNRR
jgi:phosphoribosyl-ATP pyrophosphohydrolase/phosphoribosyl-AMP cyclohydrolase